MSTGWVVRALILSIILIQGLLGTPPVPIVELGHRFVVPEGGTVMVKGTGLRVSVHAVGLEWYVDGEEDIFAEITVNLRSRPSNMTLTLGEPAWLDGIKIEMKAGDFGRSCTLLVTRDPMIPSEP